MSGHTESIPIAFRTAHPRIAESADASGGKEATNSPGMDSGLPETDHDVQTTPTPAQRHPYTTRVLRPSRMAALAAPPLTAAPIGRPRRFTKAR